MVYFIYQTIISQIKPFLFIESKAKVNKTHIITDDNYYGDPKNEPNPNLAPLEKPPYYAVEFYPGDLGTKGGLLTNEHAQVLKEDGNIIEGLYATGNTMASVMGHNYPGPGSAVGATMTFGYVAVKHIVEK